MKRLWGIYLLLTIFETILLRIAGMSTFDSLCHAFGTVATGGFSTKNTSIAGFSPTIQYIITAFMILSGINFTLHYFFLKGKIKRFFSDSELRLYLIILGIASIIVVYNLYNSQNLSLESAFRHGIFQVASITTSTGFATTDYNVWNSLGKAIILVLMFSGACAGSTSGGIKAIRYSIAGKALTGIFRNSVNPNVITPIKYNKQVVDYGITTRILNYILFYIALVILGTLILMALGINLPTSLGSIATCLGGIGPGFDITGPIGNYASLPGKAKYILTGFMILGRLEIFSVLVLFTRTFWTV